MTDDAAVVVRLERAGIPVESIDRISVTKDGDEVVYDVRTEGRTVFVRTVHPSREEGVREVLESNLDVGIPESRLLEGSPALFVMERAKGKPLSMLLPVYLVPGVWRLTASGLESGFEALGRYHGRLHSATIKDTIRIGDSDPYSDKLELSQPVERQLGATCEKIRPWMHRARDAEAVRSLIHSDPTPHNLYYWSGDVTLIDVDFRLAATVKDRLAVECGIELMAGRLPYGRRSQARRLPDAYYRGYDTVEFPDNFPHWVYLTLKAVHYCRILERYLEGDTKALRDYLTAVTDKQVIIRRVEELADSLGEIP